LSTRRHPAEQHRARAHRVRNHGTLREPHRERPPHAAAARPRERAAPPPLAHRGHRHQHAGRLRVRRARLPRTRPGRMSVYVARHGETEWNRAGRMQGRLGAPLTERGHAQARALARFAARVGVRHVIASPLARALDTARYTVEALACPLSPCDALMELDFGDCTGFTEADIAERYPTLRREREADKWRHRWPGGESYADASARVARAFEQGALPGEPGTLIVAHQALNRVLSRYLAG